MKRLAARPLLIAACAEATSGAATYPIAVVDYVTNITQAEGLMA